MNKLVRTLLIALVAVGVVTVLFTWVFPWITEMGFDPTMGG